MSRKVALITGGSRGIGAGVARTLARDGFDLALTCIRNRDAADVVATELRAQGSRVWVLQFDVRVAAESKAAIDQLLSETEVHVVVNNAGVVADAAFPALSSEAWHSVVDTSLDGFFHITQPLIMPMARRRWGRIVNVASVAGLYGNRGQVNYSAAKAGLIGATKALAMELASRNITVNAVAPGLIDTEMVANAPIDPSPHSLTGSAVTLGNPCRGTHPGRAGAIDELLKRIPMRRMGTAHEVADLVAYLVSDKAAYVTGQVIAIAGGL